MTNDYVKKYLIQKVVFFIIVMWDFTTLSHMAHGKWSLSGNLFPAGPGYITSK